MKTSLFKEAADSAGALFAIGVVCAGVAGWLFLCPSDAERLVEVRVRHALAALDAREPQWEALTAGASLAQMYGAEVQACSAAILLVQESIALHKARRQRAWCAVGLAVGCCLPCACLRLRRTPRPLRNW